MRIIIISVFTLIFMCPMNLYAEIILLNNGDRISGVIVAQDEDKLSIESEAMGVVSIKRSLVKSVENKKETQESKEKESPWKREVSAGYDKTGGNTQKSRLAMNLFVSRKTDKDEFTTKGDILYSTSNERMDSQKWYGMVRYAYSFWERKWYNFYKVEGDHDRFANIDYRLIPSTGVGYWFSDTDDWKAMVESGLGFEHTRFRDGTKDGNEPILIPRAFLQKRLFDHALISQEIILYPSLKNTGEYRLRSESALTNPINDKMSLKFSLIDDYNSTPASDIKKNDWRLISSLVYSF